MMRNGQRGAALIETALAIPVMLFALIGMTWAVRAGTVDERTEAAVRYAGVVSAQADPYHDYSLYALYNNVGTSSSVQTLSCTPPAANNVFVQGGTLPVVIPGTQANKLITPSFWQPDSFVPYCDSSTTQRQYFNGLTHSYLLLQSVPAAVAQTKDGAFFSTAYSYASNFTAEYRFYRSPDLATIMHCATTLDDAVSSSILHQGSGVALVALKAGDFTATPISVSPNCTKAIGSQAPQPPPSIPPFLPGSTPPPPPVPPATATPQPTPNPTATPATPQPSATPSPAPSASPTPAASPTTPGGKGGGGGGGGNPQPTPSGGGGGTPAPSGSPTGQPTAAPTSAPTKAPTPAPTPATPKPTATPTTSPTVKPQPSPTPTGPPGGIS